MVGLLHAPLQAVLSLAGAGLEARLAAPHLFQAALGALLLLALYRWLRESFSPGWARLGTVLFSLDRLTVHYFCPVMTEVPSALFLVLFLSFYGRRGRAREPIAGACLAALLLCRWNLALVPAALFGYELLARERGFGRRLAVVAAGCAAAAAACLAFYARLFGVTLVYAFKGLLVQSLIHVRALSRPESALIYLKTPLLAAGPVVCAAAAAGIWLGRRDERARFHAFVAAAFAAAMALLVGHKEPRFLYPVLPLFYWLALSGLRALGGAKKELLVGAALLSSAVPAAVEARGMLDPALRDPILLETARAARGAPGRIFWAGQAYTVEGSGSFCAGDGGYYVYDVPSLPALDYMLGRHLIPTDVPGAAAPPADGDALIEAPRKGERPARMRLLTRHTGRWVLARELP